jgi:hypothetical protein
MSATNSILRASAACTAGVSALLLVLASTTALHAQSGAAIHNKGGVSDSTKLNEIADTLGTKVTESPNKKDFLDKVKNSDAIYINSHIYKPKSYLHPYDSLKGRAGGLVVGDSAWYGRNDDDLVQPEDVKAAVKDRAQPCQLVIMAVCDTDKYGWGDAFGAKTTITTNRDVAGQAADVFYDRVLKGWKKGKTIQQAIDDAQIYFRDPVNVRDLPWSVRGPLKNFTDGIVVRGDPKIKYRDPTNPGHTHDKNGNDTGKSGHTHDKNGKDTSARIYYRSSESGNAKSYDSARQSRAGGGNSFTGPMRNRTAQASRLPRPQKLPNAQGRRNGAPSMAGRIDRSSRLGRMQAGLRQPFSSARSAAGMRRNPHGFGTRRTLASRSGHGARTPRALGRTAFSRPRTQFQRPMRSARSMHRPARMGRSLGGMRSAGLGGRGRRR